MKLRRLAIDRLPGIDSAFTIDVEGDGFTVVHGPNGIGKSSICRAVEALLWQDRGPDRRVDLSGRFEAGGDIWQGDRHDDRISWRRNDTESLPPPLPGSHLRHCFFLRLQDLIDPNQKTGDIAAQIQTQMSGGYDLRRVDGALFSAVKPQARYKAVRAYHGAVQKVREAASRHDAIRREADRREELNAEAENADRAGRRLDQVAKAKANRARKAEIERLEFEVSAMPASLARLPERAEETIRNLGAKLDKANDGRRSAGDNLGEAERRCKESGLDEPIVSARLEAWRSQGRDLTRVESELASLEDDHGKARAGLDEAMVRAGGSGDGAMQDVEADGTLFAFLRKAHDHAMKVSAIEHQLRVLSEITAAEDDPDAVQGIEALRKWLRAPDRGAAAQNPLGRVWWWVFALVAIVAGIAGAFLWHAALAAIAGVGAGVACARFIVGLKSRGPDERALLAGDFARLGLKEPAAWDEPSVRKCLRDLENRIAEIEARKARARDRDGERTRLRIELKECEAEGNDIAARRTELQARLGLTDIQGDADLVDTAQALDQLRRARIAEREVAAKQASHRRRYDENLRNLCDILGTYGEAPEPNAASVEAGVDRLARRSDSLASALADAARLDLEIKGKDSDIAELNADIDAFYWNLGLARDDRQGLAALVRQRPRYDECLENFGKLKIAADLCVAELEKAGEGELAALDDEALDHREAELAALAGTATGLRKRVAEIDRDIRDAREAQDIEGRIDAQNSALAGLRDQFDAELFERAGKMLLRRVEQEHETIQMPPVLERAKDLFATFTRHNYNLRVAGSGDAARLVAVDTRSEIPRDLAELSDGTRAQLLLASRLAYADQVEYGTTLPLFLDEAFDQSDPERYAEIVKSLGAVAREGQRQIVYFTNDPGDVTRIQAALEAEGHTPAQAIDLAEIRGRAERVADPAALSVVPVPAIPIPDGRSAEEYGFAIGVRPLDPRRGALDQDLFHLLWDDLDLLHVLLESGIRRVGQWRSFCGSPRGRRLAEDHPLAAQLNERANLLEAFCRHWEQGRGKPVDRDVIVESNAVSGRFLDDVVTIAAELNGRAKELMDALRTKADPRLKGFRDNSAEKLEQHLLDSGCIDERDVLAEPEILAFAMATPAGNALPDGIPRACIARWWSGAASQIGRSGREESRTSENG